MLQYPLSGDFGHKYVNDSNVNAGTYFIWPNVVGYDIIAVQRTRETLGDTKSRVNINPK